MADCQKPSFIPSLENIPSLESLLGNDSAIEANDISSLLDQFLEYEEVNPRKDNLHKEISLLTPATSPRSSDEKKSLSVTVCKPQPRAEGGTGSKFTDAGPTPPLTPTNSESPTTVSESFNVVFDLQVAEEVVVTTDCPMVDKEALFKPRASQTDRKTIPKQYRTNRTRSRSPLKVEPNRRHHSRSKHRHRRRTIRRSSGSSTSSEDECKRRSNPSKNRRENSTKKTPTPEAPSVHYHLEYEDEFGRFHKRDCTCTGCKDGLIDRADKKDKPEPVDNLQSRLAELSTPVPYDIERERKVDFLVRPEARQHSKNERRNMYVGRIPRNTTKQDLLRKFELFGPIEKVTLHFRDNCDSYAFVVFYYPEDAAKAIECGSTDESCAGLDLCFGGRRKFVGGSYVDFDGNVSYLEESVRPAGLPHDNDVTPEVDFDSLLKQAKIQQNSSHCRK